MKISLFIPTVVLCYVYNVVYSNNLQVGTVLFTTTDLVKKCWSESDKALLRARLIMQDVLPDPDYIDFSKSDVVLTLLDYFQSCYDIIGLSTYGNIQHLMYLAMSDALGGYLRGYVLPLTRKAYYAGQVKYSEAKKLFRLYDDIRSFLNTNGLGWMKPQKLCKNKLKAKPLAIGSGGGGGDPCSKLYTIERKIVSKESCTVAFDNCNLKNEKAELNPGKLKSKLTPKISESELNHEQPDPLAKQKNFTAKEFHKADSKFERLEKEAEQNDNGSSKMEDDLNGNDTSKEENFTARYRREFAPKINKLRASLTECECPDGETTVNSINRILIPLPVLDDCKIVHTIAVPFKTKPLRNIQTRKSAFILEHYYVTVIKCLMSKCSSQKDIKQFNAQFQGWLVTQVYPHLEDEQWYPAFGGIYRISETIRQLGVDFSGKESDTNDIGFIFSKGFEFDADACSTRSEGKEKIRDVGEDIEEQQEELYRSRRYVVCAIVVLAMFATCVVCFCISFCCAHGCRKSEETAPSQSSHLSDNDRFLNFHFLVRFFRRNTGTKREPSKINLNEPYMPNKKFVNYLITGQEAHDKEKKREDRENLKLKDHEFFIPLEIRGEGDERKKIFAKLEETCGIPVLVPTEDPTACFGMASLIEANLPRQTSYLKHEKTTANDDEKELTLNKMPQPAEKTSSKDGPGKIETLWNRLSNKIAIKRRKKKRGAFDSNSSDMKLMTNTKDLKSDEKKSTQIISGKFPSYAYSESRHTNCITSTTSSHTQVHRKIYPDTRKFFSRLKNKSRETGKISVDETTESDSDRETSYLSESDSSETTVN